MTTSYSTPGGQNERRPEIAVTTNLLSAGTDRGVNVPYGTFDIAVLVDGVTAGSTGTTGREFGSGNIGQDRHITFDWGVGASVVVDEIKLYLSGTTNFGTWTFDGSDDGSSWTTLHSFTMQASGGSLTRSFANTDGYRFYRLHTTSMADGGGGTGVWSEVEFKLEEATPRTNRCSWYNLGGQGSRGALVTPSTTLTFSSGVIGNVIDGSKVNNPSSAVALNSGQSSKEIVFDFGSGASVVLDSLTLWSAAAPGNTHGTWKLQGSADGMSYVDLESPSNLFDSSSIYLFTRRTVANTTPYRFYRLLQTGGSTATNPVIVEIDMRVSGLDAVAPAARAPVLIICVG